MPGLSPEGKFKAAEARFPDIVDVHRDVLRRWLEKARTVERDYKNVAKRKGVVERIV